MATYKCYAVRVSAGAKVPKPVMPPFDAVQQAKTPREARDTRSGYIVTMVGTSRARKGRE